MAGLVEPGSYLLLWDDRCNPSLPSVLWDRFIRYRDSEALVGAEDPRLHTKADVEMVLRLLGSSSSSGGLAVGAASLGAGVSHTVTTLCNRLPAVLENVISSRDFQQDMALLDPTKDTHEDLHKNDLLPPRAPRPTSLLSCSVARRGVTDVHVF